MNRTTILTWGLLAVLIVAIGATIPIVAFPQPDEPFAELYLGWLKQCRAG
ncbi:MAG: hypothetical protein ACXV3E_00865 [Halobacteriota archaeon]